MSAARLGKNWADVDEEDEEDVIADGASKFKGRCFETAPDENGIKTVVEYKEREGKTYKVTKRVKQITVAKWTNPEMTARKNMKKFGKIDVDNDPETDVHVQQSKDEVSIDLCRKVVVQSQANEAEDTFYEESIKCVESLFKEKKVWTDVNREKLDESAAAQTAAAAAAPNAVVAAMQADNATAAAKAGPAKYVPPSVARLQGKGGGKDGKGKGGEEEASLRITNISEDCREGDLQDLFGQFGRLQRVYLAKDMTTFVSKGFAFITYYTRADAQRAIDKLNGHGYDNLILQVQWAKPRAA